VSSVDFHWEHLSGLGRVTAAGCDDVVRFVVRSRGKFMCWQLGGDCTYCSKGESGTGGKGYKLSLLGK